MLSSDNINFLQDEIKSLRKQEFAFDVINSFYKDFQNKFTIEEIAWAITKSLISKLGFIDCVVYLVDDETQLLKQVAAHGPKNPQANEILNPIAIPIGKGIVGNVASSGDAILISDTSIDDRYIEDDENRLSELAVPIKVDNRVIGVIDSEHPDKFFFEAYHIDILTSIANIAGDKILIVQMLDKLTVSNSNLEKLVVERTADLSESNRKLTITNNELESYAHALSHDLKQPLRTILNYAQLILHKRIPLDETTQAQLELVSASAKQMYEQMNGLLEYAMTSSGSIEKESIDVNEIIAVVKQSLAHQLTASKGKITHIALPIIEGNRALLIQLFQNLISNALKFSQESPVISLTSSEESDYICVSVMDNGMGLEKEDNEELFDLFKRSVSALHIEGSGMGLSLCKKIMSAHQGEIELFSEGVGKGTEVKVKFPR